MILKEIKSVLNLLYNRIVHHIRICYEYLSVKNNDEKVDLVFNTSEKKHILEKAIDKAIETNNEQKIIIDNKEYVISVK